jgi:hypothetical protein
MLRRRPTLWIWRALAWPLISMLFLAVASAAEEVPSVDEIIAAGTDILGEAAMRQTNGPSYEFFVDAMPPLRYVNAEFRHYPVVLAAPRNGCKARLVSNGSAVNAKGGNPTWHDVGTPVSFYVGAEETAFGADVAKLDGPRLAQGYLPIVEMSYRDGETTYRQETFVSTAPGLANHGAVFVRFSSVGGAGKVTARLASSEPLRLSDGELCSARDQVVVQCSSNWEWNAAQQKLSAAIAPDGEAILAIFTQPVAKSPSATRELNGEEFRNQRKQCATTWQELLDRGATLEVPERIVNNAWRGATLANFSVVTGNTVNYSAGNDYLHEYITEGSNTARAFMLFGFIAEAQPMMLSLLDHSIPDFRYTVSGWKLRTLAHYYWLTRDADFLRANRQRWEPLRKLIVEDLDPRTGLVPKDFYASDIPKAVWNLKTNANCWRGLRDMAVVLREIGEPDPKLEERVRQFRQAIFEATEKSIHRDFDPPFVPNALLDDVEEPYKALTASSTGSYWCLVANDMLGSGVFDAQPEKAVWILETLQRRGGVCMGMLRFDQHSKLFANERGVDDNYTTGYLLHLLRLDDVDRALVSFYGKLAQGFTRDTFVGGEGTSLDPIDRFGRPMYLPPCTAGNAFFLWTLRYLLVQDWDTDDDGKPDTLRLLHAVPRRWLGDGARIKFERAPTAFGPLSLATESNLEHRELLVRVSLPPHRPKRTLLRARVPEGWKVDSASVEGSPLPVAPDGVVDLSEHAGLINVRFQLHEEQVP